MEGRDGKKERRVCIIMFSKTDLFESEPFPIVTNHLLWLIGQLVPSMVYDFFKLSKISP